MQASFLDISGSRIRVLYFGTGSHLLVALHGFGDTAALFAPLAEALGKQYTVAAPDLPFHGQTAWQGDGFSKSDLAQILRKIMESQGRERLSLMGFSLGGRLVLSLLPEFKDCLDKIYLLSPDGIDTKGMAWAEKTPLWLRRQLHRALRNPAWLIRAAELGCRSGLLNGVLYRFVKQHTAQPGRLTRTFQWWFALDSFLLRRRAVRAFLAASGLPTALCLGARDDVINTKTLVDLTKNLPNVHCVILDAGHRIIGEKLAGYLKPGILS